MWVLVTIKGTPKNWRSQRAPKTIFCLFFASVAWKLPRTMSMFRRIRSPGMFADAIFGVSETKIPERLVPFLSCTNAGRRRGEDQQDEIISNPELQVGKTSVKPVLNPSRVLLTKSCYFLQVPRKNPLLKCNSALVLYIYRIKSVKSTYISWIDIQIWRGSGT